MGWTGKIIGGAIGGFVSGPLGIVIGAGIGNFFDKDDKPDIEETTEDPAVVRFMLMFSMLGKLAKADGIVSKEEIAVVDDFITNDLEYDAETRKNAIKIFNEGKESNINFEFYVQEFYRHFKDNEESLLFMLGLLMLLASADKKYDSREEKMILTAVKIFRISNAKYEELKQEFFPNSDCYYQLLNCSPCDSPEKIKQQYKKLAKEYHPDLIQAKNLPKPFLDFANQKMSEIQDAYERIKLERGF